MISLDEERAVDGVAWSDDGQLLAVSTPRGNLHVFLSKLPMLGEAVGAQAVYLTGLDAVTVKRIDGEVSFRRRKRRYLEVLGSDWAIDYRCESCDDEKKKNA